VEKRRGAKKAAVLFFQIKSRQLPIIRRKGTDNAIDVRGGKKAKSMDGARKGGGGQRDRFLRGALFQSKKQSNDESSGKGERTWLR